MVQLFAGTKHEAEIKLTKVAGLTMVAERSVAIESEKADVSIAAKTTLGLKGGAAVSIDGMVKHRNIVILK